MRMKKGVAIVCLGLLGLVCADTAAGSKGSGTITIISDLTGGSAGSVGLMGGGFYSSGSLGQLGTVELSGGAFTVRGGYFGTAAAEPSAPSSFSGTALSPTSVRWTWMDNSGNESGFRVFSGAVNISGDLAANSTSWLQSGLSTNTLYGPFFVRAFNAGGTADSNTASRTTLAAPPADLAVNAVSSTTISLAWSANGNPGGTLYELQRSTGGPFVFRSTGTAASYTDLGLTPLTTYQYQVRAFNGESAATAFSNQVSTVTSSPDPATVRAVIKSPKNGRRIRGNRVTVTAKLILGDPAQTRDVLFQYKSSTSTAWSDIIPARNKEQNPDPKSPYFVHWNLTFLPPGAYNLRAVATSLSGNTDPAPPAVTIINDPTSRDHEDEDDAGQGEKFHTAHSGEDDEIEIGDYDGDQLISLVVPAGTINIGTATIIIKLRALSPYAAVAAVQDAAETYFAEVGISFEEPAAALAPGQAMMLTYSYADGAAAGVLDWTSSRTGPPALFSYETASASWRRESAPAIDPESRTVSALISHTGSFALRRPAAASPAATDLSQVRAYPIPYKPNGGNPDYGAPFSAGNPNSGIIFDSLPQVTTIKIYSAAGQLVTAFDSNAPTGRIQWDARNGSGRDVATGFYVAVISSPGQSAVTKKLLIIR